MAYEVLILPRAQKELANLPKQNYARVRDLISTLVNNPRPTGCKKLTGRDGWRVRSGNYRVIYEIEDSNMRVIVLDVGHRKDIYS
ncbi:MAG TPA: type II toxin-antitoxin system mRNA interferase toxin, RelE/StbE family [Blastocatellia bacterium]|nr:type II toxin-antitoxin system mRNA interferase toxin, RelE/StbE family [Blastocatellia bacterium]